MKPSLLIAALCAVLSGACYAQSYNRTVNTGVPYVERTGASEGVWVNQGSALQVILPFDFPYYDRTYSVCWMSIFGLVSFQDAVGSNAVYPLTPAFNPRDIAAIHVFKGAIYGQQSVDPTTFGVFFEARRVVFQWKNISTQLGESVWLNFQAHLLDTGEIRILWGPETVDVSYPEQFVSGLVPPTGNVAVPGFGTTLLSQTVRPTPGTEVVFAPSGFAPVSGIDLAPMSDALCRAKVFSGVSSNNLTCAFTLTARGAGGTVSQISRWGGPPWSPGACGLRLYRDAAPLGQFDPATDIELQARPWSLNPEMFTGLSETIDSANPRRGYFIAFDVFTPPTNFQVVPTVIPCSPTDILATCPVWGGVRTEFNVSAVHVFSAGPVVRMSGGNSGILHDSPVVAGTSDNVICTCSLRLDFGFTTPVEVTQLGWLFSGAGIPMGDFSYFRLWRDSASLGALDSADVMVGEILNPSSTVLTFSGISEMVGAADSRFLLTCSVRASSQALGAIDVEVDPGAAQSSTSGVSFAGNLDGFVRHAISSVYTNLNVQLDESRKYKQYPAQPGERYVPACAFMLQTSWGICAVTQLQFNVVTAPLTSCGLYLDNGSLPGRRDVGDTFIATGVLAAGTATFSNLALLVSSTSDHYLFTVDISTGAAPGFFVANLQGGGVT